MEMQQGGGEAAAAAGAVESPPLSPASAAAAALANARWNPTKEQVAVLEGLYEHGLRTPNAEQIQQIAGKLREHGPIEAKNVFYWFQNHKARQRQKEKQDSFAYFSRLLRRPPPLPAVFVRPPGQQPPYPLGRLPSQPPVMTMAPPPHPHQPACSNNNGAPGGATHVMMHRAPYYMAAANAGYYNLQQAHHMAVMNPRMEMMNPAAAQPPAASMYQAAPYSTSNPAAHVPPANDVAAYHHVSRSRETLELFPLQPTFLLPEKESGASLTTSTSASFSGESESLESSTSNAEALPFYDFFGLQSGGR
ncbi:hypothetical protein EJB05_18700, partial [Eragrostis curvula]